MSDVAALATVLTLIVLGIAGVCADIAIIYTIFRFKRIRTPFNIFLANWAISDLFSIILIPINYLLLIMGMPYYMTVNCLFMQTALILHITEILFGIVMCIDWCIAAYFHRVSEKFRKHYRIVIASVWIATMLCYVVSSSLCISHIYFSMEMILFTICYSLNLIFVITLQCSRVAQKFRETPINFPKPLTLRLTLITVITVSYLLAYISMMLLFFEVYDSLAALVYLIISAIVAAAAIFSSSVVTLILLCCLSYDFRSCLFQIRKPTHERFDNPISESEDHVIKPPELSFNTSTQNIVSDAA